jgi:hypothetical protein
MDELPFFSWLFLNWAPLVVTILLVRWFRWQGLLAALVLTFGLLQGVAHLQGLPFAWGKGLGDSTNPAIHAAFTGVYWAWVAGIGAVVALFVGWCRAHLRVAHE